MRLVPGLNRKYKIEVNFTCNIIPMFLCVSVCVDVDIIYFFQRSAVQQNTTHSSWGFQGTPKP